MLRNSQYTKLVLVVIITFTCACAGFASSAGKIAGRIVNEKGTGVIGANILLAQSQQGAAADADGNYVILNIAPGSYTLEVTAIGYVRDLFTNVEVFSEKITVQNCTLRAESIDTTMQVVIDGEYWDSSYGDFLHSSPTRPSTIEREEWYSDLYSLQIGKFSDEVVGRLETRGTVSVTAKTRPLLRGPTFTPGKARLLNFASLGIEETRWQTEYERYKQDAITHAGLSAPREFIFTSKWKRQISRFLHRNKLSRWIYQDGYNFYRSSLDRKLGFALNPVYGYELWNTDDERGQISRFTGGLRLEGGYRGRVRFMMDFRDHVEAGNEPYDTRSRLYEDRWGLVGLGVDKGSTSYNISESFIQYYGKDLSLMAGRGRFHWGPGQFGSLFLNSKNPPFDYVRFSAVFDEDTPGDDALFYTFLHGFLQSSLPSDTLYYSPAGRPRYLNAEKYFSGQRLEIRPRGNLLLAMNQAVIYGDRGVQLGYITPLNFLYSVQHSNDDKDNFVLGFDGTYRPINGLKIYGETFFDDIIVSELTKPSATNKSAYTVGFQGIVPRAFWQNFDLKWEYTKIRPFVYSHFFATNSYTHWYSPLGYTNEPNSEFMTAELRGSFYPYYVTLHWSRQNHGANTDRSNVGGDIYSPYSGDPKVERRLLDGKFEHTDRYGLKIQWELLENLWLFGEGMTVVESRKQNRFETHLGFAWNL